MKMITMMMTTEDSQDNSGSQYEKFYFKFDPNAWDTWGKWLQDTLNDIVESSPERMVCSWFSVQVLFL